MYARDLDRILAAIEGDKLGTKHVYLDYFFKSGYPVDGGMRLGTALQGCERLEKIENLHLEALFPPTSSEAESNDKAAPLLQVIRKSKHLRRISFLHPVGDHNRALSFRFCQAMASNPSLEDVALQSSFPGDAVCHLVRATKSIKTLHHQDLLFIPQGLGGALTANKSLQTMHLGGLITKETAVHVLRELELHANLEELILDGSQFPDDTHPGPEGVDITAVEGVLQSKDLPLKRLRLERFKFVESTMKSFTQGLRLNSSLTSLDFNECNFNKEATKEIVEFMNTESTGQVQTLQELTLAGGSFYREIFHNEPTNRIVAQMLLPPENVTGPTIGSQLSVLRILCHVGRLDGIATVLTDLFVTLGANAARVRLEQLHLDNIDASSIPALIESRIDRVSPSLNPLERNECGPCSGRG